MNITRGRLISSLFLCRVILIGTRERPRLQPREKPRKYCTSCKREVYQTVHTSDSYWADWYYRDGKVICTDCYKR